MDNINQFINTQAIQRGEGWMDDGIYTRNLHLYG